MKFRVMGKITIKTGDRPFSKLFEAENERRVRDKVYSFFGKNYKMARKKIAIASITKA